MERRDEPQVAVVGHGRWGRNLARNFHALGGLALVCDADPVSRAAAHEALGVETCADFDDVLAREDIAGVVLATPAATHAALARSALTAGRDVFSEKPLALNVTEARELAALAQAAGRVLMVGHLLEYHPALVELHRRVAAGEIGRLRYVVSRRLSLGRIRTEEDVLWSFAPHDVSMILRLAGEEPDVVHAHTHGWVREGACDVAVAHFHFASGVAAHLHVSWVHPFKEQTLVVVGEDGAFAFHDTEPDKGVRLWRHRITWQDGAPVPEKAAAEPVPIDEGEPLRRECAAFLDAITTRRPPRTDGASAVAVLDVLDRCERSVAAGGAGIERSSPSGGNVYVHPTALVDDGAEIGAGTRVWHFSHVMGSARIGRNCVLGQNVFVGPNVRMADGCKVQNNVSLYDGVELAEDVFCGPSAVFTNVMNPRAHVERKDQFLPTKVGRGASIGANATVVCGIEIGAYGFIAAGALVRRDVPPHALVMGVPARLAGWVCRCGERLDFAAEGPEGEGATCAACGDRYVRRVEGIELRTA